MIGTIALKEFRTLWRDGRLIVLGGAVLMLLLVVATLADQRGRHLDQERQAVTQAARHQWDHQGDRHPHRAAHFGLYAFKPASLLARMDPGIDAQVGQALWLEPHKRNLAMFSPAADEASSLGFGAFTPAFVLWALVPLLIVVLGHGSLTQERELGTLRMLQACGLRGTSLILGKWWGLFGSIGVVIAPAFALGGALWVSGDAWPAFALLVAAMLAYYAIWSALTVIVSARSASSRVALLVLVALWVSWVFVLPRLNATVVQGLHPLPSGQQFWSGIQRDIEQGLPGDGDAATRLKRFDAQLLADHGVTRLDQLPFGANASRRLFRDAYATRVHALHFERLAQAQQHQEDWLRGLNLLTPYAAMAAVSRALAQTDLAHRQHFEQAAEDYRQAFTTAIDDWDLKATTGLTSFESRYAGDALWQSVPAWRYQPPGWTTSLRSSALDWAALCAWMLGSLMLLMRSARRLQP